MVDRKIVEYLVMGKPHRWIKEQLGVGAGRLAKVQALAQAHGYLSGQAMPAYPQALFADRVDRRSEQRSAADAALLARKEWIEERLRAGWKAITVFEELQLTVTRSSFYRFLERHGLDRLSRDARVVLEQDGAFLDGVGFGLAHCVEDAIKSGNRTEQRKKVAELMDVFGRADA